jgi:hypothetical protein
MKYIRYEVKSPSGKYFGICTGGHDLCKLAENLGISFEKAERLWRLKHQWLTDPGIEGQYWFTEKGNELYTKELPLYEAASHEGWIIQKCEIEAADTPIYKDKYQAVF